MAGKLVEDVKFLHCGVQKEVLRNFAEMLEKELKLPGQADYGMKCVRGIALFHKELKSLLARQEETGHGDAGGLQRAVVFYTKQFFQFMNNNHQEAKKVAELLGECLQQRYVAELLLDRVIRQDVEEFFTQFGVQHPAHAKPITTSNYINGTDQGSLTDAIYKQWFGPNAKISDAFGGAEAMDIEETDYKPDEVRIIHYGLNKDDILKPLRRAFEDDEHISAGQATFETYNRKSNKHPSQVILKDLKKVKDEVDDQTHGVLMWDENFMQVLYEKPDAKKAVEELLQADMNNPRLFAHVLMKGIDLGQIQQFSPGLHSTLTQCNSVVRLTNYLGKDDFSIDFDVLARAVYKVWICSQSAPSDVTDRQQNGATHDMEYAPSDVPAQMHNAFPKTSREPVESEDHCESTSSLEMDLSEPSKTPPMHSLERYGPASSRGRSSESSCEVNHPLPNGVPAANGASRHGTEARSVYQPTSLGINASAKMVASGANNSFSRELMQKAQHNEISLSSQPKFTSLDNTISDLGLSHAQHGISSLRGPSLESGAQRPIARVATNGNADGTNKLAFSKLEHSVPLDADGSPNISNHVHPDQQHTNKWSLPRTGNADGFRPGNDRLPNESSKNDEAAECVSSGIQAASNDEGRMVSRQSWSDPRNNSNGSLLYGKPSLPNQTASTSTKNTSEDDGHQLSASPSQQPTNSNDEGRMISAQSWKDPRNNSNGSLLYGKPSLPNQTASTSTQNTSDDDGHQLSASPWPQPINRQDGSIHLGNQSLGNQTAENTPSTAQGDLSQGYHPASITNQPGVQLLNRPQHDMAVADGGAGGFQRQDEAESSSRMSLVTNNHPPSRDDFLRSDPGGAPSQEPIHHNPSNSGPVTQTSSSLNSQAIGTTPPVQFVKPVPHGEVAMASGNRSMFNREDARDLQDRINSEQIPQGSQESSGMSGRQPGVGQDSVSQQRQPRQPYQPKQPRQQNVGQQTGKEVGLLRGDIDDRPDSEDSSKSMTVISSRNNKYMELRSDVSERSNSVPDNFQPKYGPGYHNQRNRYNGLPIPGCNGLEPIASVSGSSDSNNESESEDERRKFLKNLNDDSKKRLKIVLDPLKSIIADWRNIAGKYGVNNDMITYWRSKPEKDKGPTEHLLEHLATHVPYLTVDDFKNVLKDYKRYDVLEIFKELGY